MSRTDQEKVEKLTVADYEEVLEDKRRLVSELDMLMNGKSAAKQASLCDIVGQFPQWKAKLLQAERREMIKTIKALQNHNGKWLHLDDILKALAARSSK